MSIVSLQNVLKYDILNNFIMEDEDNHDCKFAAFLRHGSARTALSMERRNATKIVLKMVSERSDS